MLYDPKWQKPEVKADPLSLTGLIAWLEKQPPEGKYCYSKWNDCLLSQWVKTFDPNAKTSEENNPRTPTGFHYEIDGRVVYFDKVFQRIAQPFGGGETWGAALERARKELGA